MKIETKLNKNDNVWMMCDNRPTKYEVVEIDFSTGIKRYIIEPAVKLIIEDSEIGQTVFLTKQELIESL